MKKFLFAALMLFIVNGAIAQIKVGVKAGAQVSGISGETYPNMKLGFYVGGFAEFAITDLISIQPELLYSTQGASRDYFLMGDIMFNDNYMLLDYINVPVLLKINFGASGLSAEVGPQIGFLLSAKTKRKMDGTGMNGHRVTTNIKRRCNTLDVSAVAGLSYTFSGKFILGARYGLGFTKIDKEYFENFKNSVISLGVGFKF